MATASDDDQITNQSDNVTSPSPADAALLTHNIQLQLEVDGLKEELAALRSELEGRAVGNGQSAGSAVGKPTPSCQQCGPCWGPPDQATAPQTLPQQPVGEEQQHPSASSSDHAAAVPPPRAPPRHGLTRPQVERYSRHLLLPSFGVAAQERLTRGSVLVVGCGGLGSPVAMYLAAAGVGRLGLVDHDVVDVTNLHRQVMHSTARVGMHKAHSGRLTCASINPTVQIDTHTCGFTPANALALTDSYDVVVDASDNPATRYLVSDACVVAGKPLVSAAAVGTDGQLTVYHYGEDGPCYRCLFPESPAPENCSRCGEAGVLGVVPGIMGCLQALEAIKILAGVGDVSSKKLTIFDALAGRFISVRLRGRSPSCVACGPSPSITRISLPSYDYVRFTGQRLDDGPPEEVRLIDPRVRLTPTEVAKMLVVNAANTSSSSPSAPAAAAGSGKGTDDEAAGPAPAPAPGGKDGVAGLGVRTGTEREGSSGADIAEHPGVLFLDVRPKTQYDIMALPGVVHVPFERLDERLPEVLALCGGAPGGGSGNGSGEGGVTSCSPSASSSSSLPGEDDTGAAAAVAAAADTAGAADARAPPRVVVLCRRGNNSQRVVARLAGLGVGGVTDMVGGYQAWAREVDPDMPLL